MLNYDSSFSTGRGSPKLHFIGGKWRKVGEKEYTAWLYRLSSGAMLNILRWFSQKPCVFGQPLFSVLPYNSLIPSLSFLPYSSSELHVPLSFSEYSICISFMQFELFYSKCQRFHRPLISSFIFPNL